MDRRRTRGRARPSALPRCTARHVKASGKRPCRTGRQTAGTAKHARPRKLPNNHYAIVPRAASAAHNVAYETPPLTRGACRLHPRAQRQGRHARDRARLRRQECRPRRAQSHAARACRRRPDRPAAANGCIMPARCRRSCLPTSPAAIATASFWRARPNGTSRPTARRRSSTSSRRAARGRAKSPASATAR